MPWPIHDCRLYPALAMINKLENLPSPYRILSAQAMMNSASGVPLPPPPQRLPASVLTTGAAVPAADESDLRPQSSFVGEFSEQMFRNRTAELCSGFVDENGAESVEPHYMTIKRKLISEFGAIAFDRNKRVVQAVFRGQTEPQGGMMRTRREDESFTGQRRKIVHFDADHYDLLTSTICALFVPSKKGDAAGGTVWCGTSDGSIDILSENKNRINIKRHSSVTTCLAYHSGKVWSGSEDGTICLTDSVDNRLVATLYEATGAIMSLHHNSVDSSSGSDLMWCGTSTGQMLQYNARTFTLHRTLILQVPIGSFYSHPLPHAPELTGIYEVATEPCIMDLLNGRRGMPERRFIPMIVLSLEDHTWIGTGRHVIVLKNEAAVQSPTLSDPGSPMGTKIALKGGRLTVTGDDQVSVECSSSLCFTAPRRGEVWGCSHCDPYMIVWNATGDRPIKKMNFAIPWGERGIHQLLTKDSCVWGSCGDGSVLVWNSAKYELLLNVLVPALPMSCICHHDDGEVAGVAKQAGYSLVVWMT